jgi:peroxiredoxin Q/BCP
MALLACAAGCASWNYPAAESTEAAASAASPLIGRPAPAFTLADQDERPVSLADLHGRWLVLYFYPRDDTPACTCQASEFTRLLGRFHEMDADVLGVSADPPRSHRAFIEKYHLKVRLLSDLDHGVMARYGAWAESPLGPGHPGRVIRSTFIIGPEGIIRHHWPEVIPWGHAMRVRQKLADLQKPPS